MIVAAAFCPHPPLLVPGLSGTTTDGIGPLRNACRAALERVNGIDHDVFMVLGSGPKSVSYSPLARGSLSGYGLDAEFALGSPSCGGATDLPLSLTIGAWLVGDVLGPHSGARGLSIGPDFDASHAAIELLAIAQEHRVTLLIMGDGSARRSVTAPGYLDARAGPFDVEVEKALRDGDANALESLDATLGRDLLAAGVPAWRVTGGLFADERIAADLSYADDPFGVAYFVATWLVSG